MKTALREFGSSHEAYYALTDENELEENDNYFYAVQDSYMGGLKDATTWLKSVETPDKTPDPDEDTRPIKIPFFYGTL